MKKMRENHPVRQRPAFWIVWGIGFGLLWAGWRALDLEGIWERNLFFQGWESMVLETGFMFAWVLFFLLYSGLDVKIPGGKSTRLLAGGAGYLLAVWRHQIFLPFLVSGLWLGALLLLGDTIGCLGEGRNLQKKSALYRTARGFVLGAGAWISLVCLLAAFGIGGLTKLRLLAGVAALTAAGFRRRSAVRAFQRIWRQLGADSFGFLGIKEKRLRIFAGIFFSIIASMLYIQLARMNLKPDYDSLHYGLRSIYILDQGKGIYENLGNINLVYTYSKGVEILAFPLAGTSTWSYQLCFNLWLTVLVLVLAGELAAAAGGGALAALGGGAAVSLMPGIMNMAITAKSDTATLVCQLCLLAGGGEFLLKKDRGGKAEAFFLALGSFFLSLSMKPTALVFSSVLALACLLTAAGKRGFFWKEKSVRPAAWGCCAALVLLGGGAWLGTWARTLLMTGVPTTSVFTSIWEKLGFQVKWPYAFMDIPDQGLEMGMGDSIRLLVNRLMGVLAAPAGEDMAHVIIAWGGSLVPLCLLAWLVWGTGEKKNDVHSLFSAAGVLTAAASLASLYLLWQVDGNYFMLLYALAGIGGSLALKQAFSLAGKAEQRAGIFLGCCAALFLTAVTLSTNWAGNTGFTPGKWKNPGYLNHQQALYEEKSKEGNQAIWSILAQDPRTRVIAWGEHPEVLLFPCNVQSYYDVTGSGGNVVLVKTLDRFKDFLRFAGIQYVYVQAGWLQEGTRAYDVVRFMIEDGSLADIRYENGNLLGRVNLDGEIPADPEASAREFYQVMEAENARPQK